MTDAYPSFHRTLHIEPRKAGEFRRLNVGYGFGAQTARGREPPFKLPLSTKSYLHLRGKTAIPCEPAFQYRLT